MKTCSKRPKIGALGRLIFAASCGVLLTPDAGLAQQASYPAVEGGGVVVELPPGKTSVISMAYEQEAVDAGAISAAGTDWVRIEEREWTPSMYARSASDSPRFYLTFLNGALEGLTYPVVDNDADRLWLDLGTESLVEHRHGALQIGDAARITPYWTLADLFGESALDSPLTPRRPPFQLGDVVWRFRKIADANTTADEGYFLLNGSGWRRATGGILEPRDIVLPPGTAWEVKRVAAPNPVELYSAGRAAYHRTAITIRGGASGLYNYSLYSVGGGRSWTLEELGLTTNGPSGKPPIVSRNPPFVLGDIVTFPMPDAEGGSISLQHVRGSGWRTVGDNQPFAPTSLVLEPGRGFYIRKQSQNPDIDWVIP